MVTGLHPRTTERQRPAFESLRPDVRAPTERPRPELRAAVGYTERSSFERVSSAVAQTRAARGVERAPDVRRLVKRMQSRLDRSTARLGGMTPRQMFDRYVADNPRVTDEQIRQMGRTPLNRLADTDRARRALARLPGVATSPHHRFTRDLVAGLTGHRPEDVSRVAPGLGVTGSPGNSPIWLSRNRSVQLSTALHDTTSYFQRAGVRGINRAMWGYGGTVSSALKSYFGGLPDVPSRR